ncbi:Hypothetical protein A7A1_1242 [Bacillus subtilis subsp. subtilis str. BSP1]|nr:Hypothetical protein A7A1_1242 [Bacillus subtilis subsp. subtilis str. BSP1]
MFFFHIFKLVINYKLRRTVFLSHLFGLFNSGVFRRIQSCRRYILHLNKPAVRINIRRNRIFLYHLSFLPHVLLHFSRLVTVRNDPIC